MKILTYGEIMDGGASVFHSVSKLDEKHLLHSFEGVIRVDNPYRSLKKHLDELIDLLPKTQVDGVVIDFSDLRFCNSNGFYIIMDIVEAIYSASGAPVLVRRIGDDDWQQETLPILLNMDEERIAKRTRFEDVKEP